ncbi:16S rRNA (guanine(527)-N(7))-methyltransferase RsmG [Moheibacter sediminis]|uniref:Ribosomal RNA small subunit methyltransferase G n=1 Tax=Moheibacter sediminis TaxID=1434700 RepID=A0A1W1ZLD1_9FLAO|nr:16S rRNA (guanine(527)-N(7))-methyltransferase RsmG [Moheibacter sediminis]SMC48851.1 16S rRNA m(7)G-527 methyltransferase [Moheibacter sediminis]
MNEILKYFPDLTQKQIEQFSALKDLYFEWNEKINVISRKDIDELYTKHVLHSLAIAKVISFENGTQVLDVGTGGGFPGIPLAIMFPEVEFHLVDSITKKILVVNEVSSAIGLTNLKAEAKRAEQIKSKFDFVVSRAVTAMPKFVEWIEDKFESKEQNSMPNGILYLKGGDLEEELFTFPQAQIFEIPDYFDEPFFETKKVVYISAKSL